MRAPPPDHCCLASELAAHIGLIAALAVLGQGCVVAEFDRVRQASQARAQCDVDASDEESVEHCVVARDASLDALGEGDAAPALPADASSSESDSASSGTGPSDASSDASMSLLPDDGGMSALEAGPSDAGPVLMCLDTISDPKNCGQCGKDCAAPNADPICENKECVRECKDGWGDCNGNLKLGNAADGCERRLDNDVKNCAICNRQCLAPDFGFAACKAKACTGYRLVQGARALSELYGNASGGGPFDMQCQEGQVLTGIEGVGDTVAYGLQARCATLKVSRSGTTTTVSTVAPPSFTRAVGGNITPAPPAYALPCQPGEVVSALSGTLWIYPGSGVNAKVVKTLSITCASVQVGADNKITLTAKNKLTIGEPESSPLVAFESSCPGAGVIGGFSGRAGAYIDGISAWCGPLLLEERPVGSVMVAAD